MTRDAKKKAKILADMYQQKEDNTYKFSILQLCAALDISKGTLYKYLKLLDVPKRGDLFNFV